MKLKELGGEKMVLVKLFAFGIAIYCLIVLLFFVNELEKNQKKEQEEQEKKNANLVRNAYLRGNEFIRQFFKDLKEPPKGSTLSELPLILANKLFETVGKKFSTCTELSDMNFSHVNFKNGFYEFSFRIISGNLDQNASLLKDMTSEAVKDVFFSHNAVIADADVQLEKISPNIAQVTVRCANNEATYSNLQAFKSRLANIKAKKQVELVSDVVDEELERDLGGL